MRFAILSRGGTRVPRVLAPLVATGWSVIVGILGIAVLVTAAGFQTEDLSGSAVLGWLAAHHATIATPVGDVTLLPLGLAIVPVLAVRRAARWLASSATGSRRYGAVTAFAGYVTCAAVLAATTQPDRITVPVWSATVSAALVAGAAGAWGFRRELRSDRRLPAAVSGVAVAFAVPVAVGGLLIAIAIGANAADMAATRDAIAPQGSDLLGLLLLQIGYLPNAILWAGAYALGPGISVGGGVTISPYDGAEVALPALPLFDAMPSGSPQWTAALPIVVVLGGALGAMTAHRRSPRTTLNSRLVMAASMAAGTFLVWVIAGRLAGGSLGAGRFEQLGPASGSALAAAGLVAAGAVIWALLPTLVADARPMAVDVGSRIGAELGSNRRFSGRGMRRRVDGDLSGEHETGTGPREDALLR